MRAFISLLWLTLLLGTSQRILAQGVNFFSTQPDTFITEFVEVLSESKHKESNAAGLGLSSLWTSGEMTEGEKETFILLTNLLVSKRMTTYPALTQFVATYQGLKQEQMRVKVPAARYLAITSLCAEDLTHEELTKYLSVMSGYLQEGYPARSTRSFWYVSTEAPDLAFEEVGTGEAKRKVPVVKLSNTDLKYQSYRSNDSSIIIGTSGRFYPLSMKFWGQGGRVTWEKLGLDPEDVYCDLEEYALNLNFGLIKADTVTFYYKSLIPHPVKGHFEDRNAGYQNRERANYPFFQSHEGGIVIDKLITNFRFEGGFMLRGIRRIGTGFDVMQEMAVDESGGGDFGGSTGIADTKFDDPFGDADFGGMSDEEEEGDVLFSGSDSDFDEWDSGEDGGGGFGAFGGFDGGYVEKVHHPARMELMRGDRTIVKLSGETFLLEPEEMVGRNLMATIYTSTEDSIYHPDMNMYYKSSDSTVVLEKPREGKFRNVPFTSSYHDFYLYFEAIVWNLIDDELRFTALVDPENKVAAIESFDYFTRARMNQYKGVLKFNPVGAIYYYMAKTKARYKKEREGMLDMGEETEEIEPDLFITPDSILAMYNMTDPGELQKLELALPRLEESGFITYDPTTREITPLPKLSKWARAARKSKDYDAVRIIDTSSTAIMNVETMDIALQGVQGFSLSDSVFLRVNLTTPESDSRVVLQKNRNLRFGGRMSVGRMDFYSSDIDRPSFTFDYDSYRVICDSVDSLRFNLLRDLRPGQQPTAFQQAISNTVFNKVTGAVHVDDPNNKSGEKGGPKSTSAVAAHYAQFPVFDSYSRSYIYWDKPAIQSGVYDQDSLNFSVYPFVLDSLETFDESSLKFDGEFYSSTIFPTFEQELQVMLDSTLGLRQQTPDNGYRIYGRNGKFLGEITMDSYGLCGNGQIEYLGTVAKSDTFVFHFDSVMAEVNYFNLRRGYRRGTYFPKVDAENAIYTWYTKDSLLSLQSKYDALSVFDGEGSFEGELSITEDGMTGDGTLTMGDIQVEGEHIVFNEMDFEAENANFVVANVDDPTTPHFRARNAKIDYNVRGHKSSFESTPGTAIDTWAEFPLHQYATTLSKGTFNRRDSILTFQTLSDTAASEEAIYEFVSTDPKQDRLRFLARDAKYDVTEREVRIEGVPDIYVADAIITPDSTKEVILLDNGKIKTLENATVEADQTSRMHRIYEANVEIQSRHEYTGSGKYDYIEINGKEQFINFENIRVGSGETTIASGEIEEADEFYLTERVLFRGQAELDATNRFLNFNGEVKIESDNPVFKGAWFPFEKANLNPDSVFIPIADGLEDKFGQRLAVGLEFDPDDQYFYSRFLQARSSPDDKVIIDASGGLTFDRKEKVFRIGTEDRLQDKVYRGAKVSFNDSTNIITSQGLFKFPSDFVEKTISMQMSGSWTENINRNTISTDLMIGIDLGEVIPENAIGDIMKLINGQKIAMGVNPDIDFLARSTKEAAAELLDQGEGAEKETNTKAFIKDLDGSISTKDLNLAGRLPYDLLLSNVDFKYNSDYRALYSDSEVGLVGLGGGNINKMVNARIVYQFGSISVVGEKEPDALTILLELDRDASNVLYLHYEEETLYTYFSSVSFPEAYNKPIQDAIAKRKDNNGFRIEMATEDELATFTRDFVLKFIR